MAEKDQNYINELYDLEEEFTPLVNKDVKKEKEKVRTKKTNTTKKQ